MPVLKGTRLQGSTFGYKSDPLFRYTSLLLPGVGTNGANNNVFVDASTNNFAITRNGNTTQGTFSPFSQTGWSNYFDGTGDYFTVPYSANFDLSSGDWTMEAWFNANSFASAIIIIAKDTYGVNYDWSVLIGSSTSISLYTQRTAVNLTVTVPAMSVGVWYHVAYVRNGSTNTIYLNGVSYGSNTMTISNESLTTPTIGCGSYNNPGGFMNGYISNLRVVKGTAVYTSNFTPPTAPLTAISGTSLLTCQSNRFLDASTNNLTITKNGDTRVVAFSPFAPTAEYTPSIHSGSGYFDGSGDYLGLPTSQQIVSATGDLTIECFVYPTSLSSDIPFYTQTNGGASSGRFNLFVLTSGALYFQIGGSSYTGTSGVVKINQWNFISATRTGSSVSFYVNGASVGSGTVAGTIDTGSSIVAINRAADGTVSTMPIYYGSFRISNIVRSNLTNIPTAPYTSDTNTSLLLNFTNAGVYDATGKNNLETVGDTKISTAQSKFGLASMAFDGTGDSLITVSKLADFGTGNFTAEGWIYVSNSSIPRWIMDSRNTGSDAGFGFFLEDSTGYKLRVYRNGSYLLTSSSNIAINTWYHVVFVRNNSNSFLYINGTQVASAADTNSYIQSGSFRLGTGWNNNDFFIGYMNDMRVTKGIARYTANFTPQASYLPLR